MKFERELIIKSALFFNHMDLDREILKVLSLVGNRGLSVQKISIHVHNACNTLFNECSYEKVHAYVLQYLIRNSKNQNSLIERTSKRGIYRLNFESPESKQLMLQFVDSKSSDNDIQIEKDNILYLDLF